MQYAIADDKVYVLEANPRASRTVPLVSKVCNINMVRAATEIITSDLTGKKRYSSEPQRAYLPPPWCEGSGVPFNMFQEVDPVLGPEMCSTGEVLGLSNSFGVAFFKSQEATQLHCPRPAVCSSVSTILTRMRW